MFVAVLLTKYNHENRNLRQIYQQHTISTVYTHFTSVNSGSGGRSPQYLSIQSKHSNASGDRSGGKRNSGVRIGVPCHLTKSECGLDVVDIRLSDRPFFG